MPFHVHESKKPKSTAPQSTKPLPQISGISNQAVIGMLGGDTQSSSDVSDLDAVMKSRMQKQFGSSVPVTEKAISKSEPTKYDQQQANYANYLKNIETLELPKEYLDTFNADNFRYVSAESGKIGSIYFGGHNEKDIKHTPWEKLRSSGETSGGRIRVIHSLGPQVNYQSDVKRVAIRGRVREYYKPETIEKIKKYKAGKTMPRPKEDHKSRGARNDVIKFCDDEVIGKLLALTDYAQSIAEGKSTGVNSSRDRIKVPTADRPEYENFTEQISEANHFMLAMIATDPAFASYKFNIDGVSFDEKNFTSEAAKEIREKYPEAFLPLEKRQNEQGEQKQKKGKGKGKRRTRP